MIVQCEACQTRFRLADDKVKPGGTKVRCSKCKEVFTVTPPEPEPVEEAVDFGSFNMEKVTEETSDKAAPTTESSSTDASEPVAQPESEPESVPESSEAQESSELDFSALETEMGDGGGLNEELADDFSFADTSQPLGDKADDEIAEDGEAFSDTGLAIDTDTDFSIDEEQQEEQAVEEQADFGSAFEETEEPDGPIEFDFNEDTESDSETVAVANPDAFDGPDSDVFAEPDSGTFEGTETDFAAEEPSEPAEFSFGEEEPEAKDEPAETPFGDDGAFDFDDTEEETPSDSSEEDSEPGEFSFDDDNPFGEESASEWDDDSSSEDTSFDFEEPTFEDDDSPAESSDSSPEEDGLQFGEIDFASDGGSDESEGSGFETNDDFSQATMELQEEPEQFTPSQPSPPSPSHDYDNEGQLSAPPPPKKSSLSRILLLLVLLLVILGGAAGYLFMQEGSLNLNIVVKYLPFLQDYIGEVPTDDSGDRIGINVDGSSYVKGQAGQMLIIQGAAVNNHKATRSAITVKGVLLDAKGKTLLQQTVFCGNPLEETALHSMSFAAIEEAMNNQFGDSLSNMNVAAGASIPFTIVFRNLPEGIANINVEVVDSKPGAG